MGGYSDVAAACSAYSDSDAELVLLWGLPEFQELQGEASAAPRLQCVFVGTVTLFSSLVPLFKRRQGGVCSCRCSAAEHETGYSDAVFFFFSLFLFVFWIKTRHGGVGWKWAPRSAGT